MRYQRSHLPAWLGIFVLLFWLFLIVSWVKNVYEITQCDYEAPYKCEVLHLAGLVPGVSMITAWVDAGK
jgi:hypothetical protein